MRWAVAASPEAQTPPERRVDWAVRGPDAARCTQLSRCWQKVILRAQLTATDTDGIRGSPARLRGTANALSILQSARNYNVYAARGEKVTLSPSGK